MVFSTRKRGEFKILNFCRLRVESRVGLGDLCFGLLMGACVLADQKGYVITCLGGLEGMTCGMGLFRFIGKIIGNDDMGLISLLIVTVGIGVVGVQLRQKMYQQTGR